jgi:hypothetical protein
VVVFVVGLLWLFLWEGREWKDFGGWGRGGEVGVLIGNWRFWVEDLEEVEWYGGY